MKKSLFFYLIILSVVVSGCESMGENTKKGAGLGGLAGAAAGGIIGHQDGHGWEGALIGAAAGATLGGIIGNQIDKREVTQNTSHLSLNEIVKMIQDGTPDSVIISEIDRTRSKYKLNAETINWLESKGASDRLIDHIMATTS